MWDGSPNGRSASRNLRAASRVSKYRTDTKGADQKTRCYYRVKLTDCAPSDPSRRDTQPSPAGEGALERPPLRALARGGALHDGTLIPLARACDKPRARSKRRPRHRVHTPRPAVQSHDGTRCKGGRCLDGSCICHRQRASGPALAGYVSVASTAPMRARMSSWGLRLRPLELPGCEAPDVEALQGIEEMPDSPGLSCQRQPTRKTEVQAQELCGGRP